MVNTTFPLNDKDNNLQRVDSIGGRIAKKTFVHRPLCFSFSQFCLVKEVGSLTPDTGLWFFVSFRNVFSDNTRVRIFFFSESNIRLYDKNSESDHFFSYT